MLKNIELKTAPIQIFPDLNWFLNYAKDGHALHLANITAKHKAFYGNRFKILGPNSIKHFSIPLQKSSFGHNISDLLISNQSKWYKEFKHTLQTVYGKTPFFEYFDYKLWHIFENQKDEVFINLVKDILEWAFSALQWDVEIKESNQEIETEFINYKINPYYQPFADKLGFVSDAPIFDAIFCLGPELRLLLKENSTFYQI